MSNEYKLSYTAEEINRKLGKVDNISWNDLNDKPFGEESGIGDIFTETTLTFVDRSYKFNEPLQIEGGKTYTVTYNGVPYNCVANAVAEDGTTAITLGDSLILDGEDDEDATETSKPFCILTLSKEDAEKVGLDFTTLIVSRGYETNATISIVGEKTTIHPIEGKYLPEGTPWIEEGEMVEILPETTVQFDPESGEGMVEGAIPMSAGETYTVEWNGTEYSCVALDVSALMEGETAVAVGDGTAFGMSGNGEPFIVVSIPSYGATMFMDLTGATEAVVSIYQGGTTIHKLDNRCLDLAWVPTVTDVKGKEVYPATTKQLVLYSGIHLASYTDTAGIELEANKTYIVVWEGTEYKCKSVGEASEYGTVDVFLGNNSLMSAFGGTGKDTGEPFYIARTNTGHDTMTITLIAADGGEESTITRTVGIFETEKEPNKLPAEFLPDDLTFVTLTSPNGTKFKITVADDGTLSATAI